MKTVVIMRGIPGSGKSTKASIILEHAMNKMGYNSGVICSNDFYPGYYDNVERSYDWTPTKAKAARRFCQEKFEQAIKDGVELIIVDNCHLTHKSYSFYKQVAEDVGYEVSIHTFQPVYSEEYIKICSQRNKHKVTENIIRDMLNSWQE